MSNHLIQKMTVELNFTGPQAVAQKIGQETLENLGAEITPRLESVFGELVTDDRAVEIKRLEIDLGSLSTKRFREEFIRRCLEQIEEELGKPHYSSLKSQAETQISDGGDSRTQVESEKLAITAIKRFFHFLKSGNLGWYNYSVDWTTFEEDVLSQSENTLFLEELLLLVFHYPEAVKRFQYQFTDKLRDEVLKELASFITSFATLKSEKKENTTSIDNKKEAELLAILDLLAPASTNKQMLKRGLDKWGKSRNSVKSNSGTIPKEFDTGDGYYVEYAGMGLIIPCYYLVLMELKWIDGKEFTSSENQLKAIYLLHWIATGSTSANESDLLLAKIVCGYPLEKSLPRNIAIPQEELDLTLTAIHALLAQWTIGKNETCICPTLDGLRQNFLARKGKLTLAHEKYYLKIEGNPTDAILLKTVPWTISMVRFSWMDGLLNINWQ